MDKTKILRKISKCFQNSPSPEKGNILKTNLTTFLEAEQIRESFDDISWESLNFKTLTDNKAAIDYFSDAAFAYFLPAFMKAILLDIDRSDTIAAKLLEKLTLPIFQDMLIEYLDYLKDEKKLEFLNDYYKEQFSNINDRIHDFIKRTSLLSIKQSQCVLLFLKYLQKHNSDYFDKQILHYAIYRYWFKF